MPATSENGARRPPPARRFLFYSHDGLGLGHVRRNLSVAGAISELDPAASVLIATSADEAESLGVPDNVDILKLPGLRKVDNDHYAARRLPVSFEEVQVVRETLLAAAAASFRPDVVLADKHPLGVGGELLLALETARAGGARTVFGLRDILDSPAAVTREWHTHGLFQHVREHYDRVLVYGQPDLLDPRREYDFPHELSAITSFCGYVVAPEPLERWRDEQNDELLRSRGSRPVVLASAGGGEDGFEILSAFIAAAAQSEWQAVVVSGPHCPPARVDRLRDLAAEARVDYRTFLPGLNSRLSSLDALVCMGGYNTLAEAAASGVPTVCVPRVEPRLEQLVRARAFARRGLLRLLDPSRLTARSLRAEVEAALEGRGNGNGNGQPLDTGGAERAARQLIALAGRPTLRALAKEGHRAR
jgi:predicted glycosyltransferase